MAGEEVHKPEAAAASAPEAEKPTEIATATEPEEAPKETPKEAAENAPAPQEATETQEAAEVAPVEAAQVAPVEAVKEAPEEAPKQDSKEDASTPKQTPIAELWDAAKSNGHPEIWGVTLVDPSTHIPTQIILQKYLNANDGDLVKAKDQLIKTLEWRAKTKPLDLVKKTFSKAKFEGLGYVTSYVGDSSDAADPENKEVFTWNIYGGVKSIDETFGNLEE